MHTVPLKQINLSVNKSQWSKLTSSGEKKHYTAYYFSRQYSLQILKKVSFLKKIYKSLEADFIYLAKYIYCIYISWYPYLFSFWSAGLEVKWWPFKTSLLLFPFLVFAHLSLLGQGQTIASPLLILIRGSYDWFSPTHPHVICIGQGAWGFFDIYYLYRN